MVNVGVESFAGGLAISSLNPKDTLILLASILSARQLWQHVHTIAQRLFHIENQVIIDAEILAIFVW